MKNLTKEELVEINGGNEKTYNLGHEIGVGIRKGLEAIGIFLLFW
ncbi:MAG: hypothetical protein AB1777_11300 [Bacteroidota bacterium]